MPPKKKERKKDKDKKKVKKSKYGSVTQSVTINIKHDKADKKTSGSKGGSGRPRAPRRPPQQSQPAPPIVVVQPPAPPPPKPEVNKPEPPQPLLLTAPPPPPPQRSLSEKTSYFDAEDDSFLSLDLIHGTARQHHQQPNFMDQMREISSRPLKPSIKKQSLKRNTPESQKITEFFPPTIQEQSSVPTPKPSPELFSDMPPPVSLSVNQYSGSGRIPRPIAAELDTRPLLDAPQKEMFTIAKKKKK